MYKFQFEVDIDEMKKTIHDHLEMETFVTDEMAKNAVDYISDLFWNNQKQVLHDEVHYLSEYGQLDDAIKGLR
jgi:pyridoxine 5'-phosphate synthase PdxJ